MANRIIVDTGPLVAILREHDEHHEACSRALQGLTSPPLTCWPVLTEAAYILRHEPPAVRELLEWPQARLPSVRHLPDDAGPWMVRFIERYNKRQPDLADAALMYLAERERVDTIFTVDRRDFSVYRFSDGRAPKLLPEWA